MFDSNNLQPSLTVPYPCHQSVLPLTSLFWIILISSPAFAVYVNLTSDSLCALNSYVAFLLHPITLPAKYIPCAEGNNSPYAVPQFEQFACAVVVAAPPLWFSEAVFTAPQHL